MERVCVTHHGECPCSAVALPEQADVLTFDDRELLTGGGLTREAVLALAA